MRMIIIIT